MTAAEPRGGVSRVLGPAEAVADTLRRVGWDVAVVPPAATDAELWDGLAAALELPRWFGRNLDALDEVLAERGRPTALVLGRWWAYARARPERWQRLLGLLRVRAAEQPAFLVVLTD